MTGAAANACTHEPVKALFRTICEGTREASRSNSSSGYRKQAGKLDRNPVRRTSQTIANVYYGSMLSKNSLFEGRLTTL
jgi:hypothetical protein